MFEARSLIYLVARTLLVLLAVVIFVGSTLFAAIEYPMFRAFILGGITIGPVFTWLVGAYRDERASRSLSVVGRDVPAARLVFTPSKEQLRAWRRERA
jgi:hypothetical protein